MKQIDTLLPNGFTQHWTLLGISFPLTLVLYSFRFFFSRRRNFMPNYLGNSDTKCNIFLQVNFALAKIFLPLFAPGVPLVFTWLSLSRIKLHQKEFFETKVKTQKWNLRAWKVKIRNKVSKLRIDSIMLYYMLPLKSSKV